MQLTAFNRLDLATKAGGMQLLPENADYYVEMIRISALVGALPMTAAKLPPILDNHWRQWINSGEPMANTPEMAGDPHEGLFVAEIPCYGGGYLTIPSDSPGDPFVVECLLEAALLNNDAIDSGFKQSVAELALTGLWISDQCLRRGGLNRSTVPGTTKDNKIRWPNKDTARKLQAAVTFAVHDVKEALEAFGLGTSGISELSFTPNAVSATYSSPSANPVRRRPLLTIGDTLVVISPTTVLIAVRDAILELAKRYQVTGQLMTGYRDAVGRRIDSCADLLRWQRLGGTISTINGTCILESFYQFDCDKAAAVFVICDDLQTNSTHEDDRIWNLQAVFDGVGAHAADIEKQLFSMNDSLSDILRVVVVQGVGRFYTLALKDRGGTGTPMLSLSADEFRVFAMLNMNDELSMWQVAQARRQLPRSTSIFGGFLDHYAQYRNRHHSYYFGDDGVPDCVLFVASGMQLRIDAQLKYDPHVVSHPFESKYCKVIRLESRPGFPIYAKATPDHDIELLIEGLPFPVWVVAAATSQVAVDDYRELFFHLVDATAFWVWQCTPALNRLASQSAADVTTVAILIRLAEPDAWFVAKPILGEYGIVASHDNSKSTITLELGPAFAAHSSQPQNIAERELARNIVEHLAGLLNVPLDVATLDAIVDQHAPLGIKRRFSIARGITQETLDTEGLPRVRRIQSFDEQIITDILGSHLRDTLGYGVGEIGSKDHSKLCNASVAFIFGEFQSLVSRLAHQDLFRNLIARQESLIADRRLLDVILATHLACFGQSNEILQECQKDITEADRSCLAGRFVIEYVATRPPAGTQRLSLSEYDRLLAMASEISHYGRLSDVHRYKLTPQSFEILKSGRLAASAPQYEQAIAEFYETFFQQKVRSSVAEYNKAMKIGGISPDDPMPPEVVEIENVTAIEFGSSIRTLREILETIMYSPFTSSSGVGECDVAELIRYVSSHASCNTVSVASAIDVFTLGPRDDFLAPEKPYSKADVYPWRFNRGLSYLRRPLLRVDSRLMWGRRALRQAADYLLGLCMNGRLKNVRTREMQEYQGKVSNRIGEHFNQSVAKAFDGHSQFVVRKKIAKINGRRIARDNGEVLGDIDVLVAEPDKKRILALEAKCLSLAKTPAELANERDSLFGDLTNRTGDIGRHLERTEWLRVHLDDILNELGLDLSNTHRWQVFPFLIVDSDLISTRLCRPAFPIVLFKDLPYGF